MIINYISEETRKKYEGKLDGKPKKEKRKAHCPDCEIREMKRSSKEKKFNVEVIHDDSGDIIKETK